MIRENTWLDVERQERIIHYYTGEGQDAAPVWKLYCALVWDMALPAIT